MEVRGRRKGNEKGGGWEEGGRGVDAEGRVERRIGRKEVDRGKEGRAEDGEGGGG